MVMASWTKCWVLTVSYHVGFLCFLTFSKNISLLTFLYICTMTSLDNHLSLVIASYFFLYLITRIYLPPTHLIFVIFYCTCLSLHVLKLMNNSFDYNICNSSFSFLKVRTIKVEKRINEIVNRLNKTKVERKPDLKGMSHLFESISVVIFMSATQHSIMNMVKYFSFYFWDS